MYMRKLSIVDYVVIPLIVVDLDTFHKELVIIIMENDTIGSIA
jgi:hypothetical protein